MLADLAQPVEVAQIVEGRHRSLVVPEDQTPQLDVAFDVEMATAELDDADVVGGLIDQVAELLRRIAQLGPQKENLCADQWPWPPAHRFRDDLVQDVDLHDRDPPRSSSERVPDQPDIVESAHAVPAAVLVRNHSVSPQCV